MHARSVVAFVDGRFWPAPDIFADPAVKLVLGAIALRHRVLNSQCAPAPGPIPGAISTAVTHPPVMKERALAD